jgi:DNA-binding NarL/FixJ family response regulator
MAQMTFIIADDHPLFRGAMRQALEGIDANIEILEAGDLESARKKAGDHPEADLILLDLTMPGVSGLSGLIAFRAEFSSLPVVVVSATDDVSTMRRALELGASGFISKSASIDEIREGVRTVLGGGIWTPPDVDLGSEHDQEIASLIARIQTLTPQQGRVLGMLAEGLLNKQIAYELGVSEATIKAHVSAVLQKLGVDSRTQAVIQLSKIGAEVLSQETERAGYSAAVRRMTVT